MCAGCWRILPKQRRDAISFFLLIIKTCDTNVRTILAYCFDLECFAGLQRNVASSMHNMWRATIIIWQAEHSGVSECIGKSVKQHAISTVPSINGLQWVANNKHVWPTTTNFFEQCVLQRVHVLGFVNEQMLESKTHSLCVAGVCTHVGNHTCEQVV